MKRAHPLLAAASVVGSGLLILVVLVAGLQGWSLAAMPPQAGNARGNTAPAATIVFDNFNGAAVANGPTAATTFTLQTRFVVTWVRTYHWNFGHGKPVGSVSIVAANGQTWGPWPAQGMPGQGGVRDANWDATPVVTLPPGTYTIRDSDPATWSQNAASGHAGFAQVKGYPQAVDPSPVSDATLAGVRLTPLLTRTLSPSSKPQIVQHDRITVTIPGGSIRQNTELRISSVSNPPPPPTRFDQSLGAFDITLGNLHEFDRDIEIAIPVDPSRIPADRPATAVAVAAFYDPAAKRWVELPTRYVRETRTLVARTRHLSFIDWWWYASGTYSHFSGDFCFVLYDPKDVSKTHLRGYVTEGLVADPASSGYAEDVFAFGEKALKKYASLGLETYVRPLPILIEGNDNPGYLWSAQRVQFPTNRLNPAQLNYAIAHEAFHAVQHSAYSQSQAWNRLRPTRQLWWLEATAEYAASRVAMEAYAQMGNPNLSAISPRYFTLSLDTFGESSDTESAVRRTHQYQTAWFIDFICRQKQRASPTAFFVEMYKSVAARSGSIVDVAIPDTLASGSALDSLAAFLRDKGEQDGLDRLYRDYALHYLFSAESPMDRAGVAGGDVHPKALEGTNTLRGGTTTPIRAQFLLNGNHSAQVHAVSPVPTADQAAMHVRMEIAGRVLPARTAVFLCKTARGDRTQVQTVAAFNGPDDGTRQVETTVRRNEWLYLVAVNDAATTADITAVLTPVDEKTAAKSTVGTSSQVPAGGGGVWVQIKKESYDTVTDPIHAKSHHLSEGSFQAEVIPRGGGAPVPMEGSWASPPAVLRPGSRLPLTCSGAIQVEILEGASRLALSLPPACQVWEVTPGSKGALLFYDANVASSFFNCGWTYTYEWRAGAAAPTERR